MDLAEIVVFSLRSFRISSEKASSKTGIPSDATMPTSSPVFEFAAEELPSDLLLLEAGEAPTIVGSGCMK